MIDKRTIFEIHRLKDSGLSRREIARRTNLSRETVHKYLDHPDRSPVSTRRISRSSKLNAYRELIDEFLEQQPDVRATVVLQRLCEKGFTGRITIVRDYLRKHRPGLKKREPFIRFESAPGQQMQMDWGLLGSIAYGNTRRNLYALVLTECYSRMMYVEFTHSQKQEVLHQGMLNALIFFGGSPEELVVDNMRTAVIERQDALIRFNDAFLDFLRRFKIVPIACHVRAPHEKGKIEKAIDYVKHNFWPLRTVVNLDDVQQQSRVWLDTIANVRNHQTTGEQPVVRFASVKLRLLPDVLPDCREICQLKVHKDFCVRFDGNTYTVPPWAVGREVTVKADQKTVTVFLREKKIAQHSRCWERCRRIEIPAHQEQVKKLRKRRWQDQDAACFASLGQEAREYLNGITNSGLPIKKTLLKLLALKDEYGAESLRCAIRKAIEYQAFGADYIENILYQEMTPHKPYEPVCVKDEALNRIRLCEPSLADYDAIILKRRKYHGD